MPRVLVTPTMLNNVPGRYSERLTAAGFEIVYPPKNLTLDESVQFLLSQTGIEAMVASVEPLARDVLSQSNLRVVARMGVGFDCIDIAAATELGIVVTITPGVLEESVAEHTMAMMFAAARDLLARDAEVRRGDWSRKAFPRLSGKTIGLIGLGRIGRVVAAKSRALGMNVLATDPAADATFAAAGDVRLCSLDELLAESDVVSLHVPATAKTIDLIDAAALKKMKPRAILINTSRGALVDEDALADAMQSGHLLGAALDVFKTEPLPTDSPLMKLDRVLLCTHMGGLDEESVEGMSRSAAESIARLYRGDWPAECVVNPDVQAGFSW